MSDFHEEFLRESEEQVTELNNGLLALESDPDDAAAMDAVFRSAHTLKGNAAAMGFDGISDIAHAVEDLLAEIRNGHLTVTPERMDVVFEGVDRIESALNELEAERSVDVHVADLVEEIRGRIDEANAAAEDAEESPKSTAESADESPSPREGAVAQTPETSEAPEDGRTATVLGELSVDPATVDEAVTHARVDVKGGMKGVDAMMVFDELVDRFDVLASRPDRDTVEDGKFDDGFDLVVAGASADTLSAVFDGLGPVSGATVTAVDAGREAGPDSFDTTSPVDDPHTDSANTADGAGETAPEGETAADGAGSPLSDARDATADGDPTADQASPQAAGPTDEDGTDDGAETSVDDVKSVHVDVDQLEDLHGLVEQLVTSRIKLRRALQEDDVADARDTLEELDKVSTSLQDTVMDMQLIPLRKVVGKFPRLIRDLTREQDKSVDFRMEGEAIELDRTILTRIGDPLMHILRNAIDHGIEPPDEREAAGKPREGTVELRARREGDHVFIEVEDDGRGLEADEIRGKAASEGIRSREELESMSADDVYDLVFHPGFSTSEEVTDVSGRGVGMDVVHSTVMELDGAVDVASAPGEGTTVTLRLPVTIAIVTVLFVRVGDERFGVPLKAIDEVEHADGIRRVNGQEIVDYGGDLYPVIRLADALDVDGTGTADDGMVVRIRESERRVALHCDAVEDQEEVVVKPLEGILSGTEGLSGTAVLGDGNLVPILDVMTL